MLSSFEVEPLRPFGVKLTPKSEANLAALSSEEMEVLIREHKLVLIRGLAPLKREPFLEYCQSFKRRQVFHWSFGPVMEMREAVDPANYLFSRERVPFHWDGAFATVPTYLVFSCVEAPSEGGGGETLFCDTESVFEASSLEDRDLFARAILRYETQKVAHYGGVVEGPLLQVHPEKKKKILRYAEPVETELNPVSLEIKGLSKEEAERLRALMQECVYDPRFCHAHSWQEGDLLFADNHSLVHGRRAFELGSPRHLRRIQLV